MGNAAPIDLHLGGIWRKRRVGCSHSINSMIAPYINIRTVISCPKLDHWTEVLIGRTFLITEFGLVPRRPAIGGLGTRLGEIGLSVETNSFVGRIPMKCNGSNLCFRFKHLLCQKHLYNYSRILCLRRLKVEESQPR
jgi:hypothetical protein